MYLDTLRRIKMRVDRFIQNLVSYLKQTIGIWHVGKQLLDVMELFFSGGRFLSISARNRTQVLDDMSSALPLSY